ncbi:hypothetical protein A1O7_07110 [Cladophialophora yegresii CBS 114405]|uniref:Amidase domain-containing protein n=1 Tax=Cladophialophora yegresii CBS 114405 TaxID=1182544 RepID=W9VX06_9EURO|nr:uncharacterized protein A1O7_07110 [Cladophialophora yegresii CBS 114405]EXJ56766.1 hypothetical protein A1O7_07110 [Cladophialophora yegresii CBS 114405]
MGSSGPCPLDIHIPSLNIEDLRASYTARTLSSGDVIRNVYAKISAYPDPAVWVYLVPLAEAMTRAEELAAT